MAVRGARFATIFALIIGALNAGVLGAQESELPLKPDGGVLVLDIDAARQRASADPELVRRCEAEAEAGRITGEIVVCRSIGAPSDGAWNAADFERRYAQATQGIKTPGVDGTGVRLPGEGSLIAITVTTSIGEAPEPPLIIDIAALPEAPPGSDAERIAQGLPPR